MVYKIEKSTAISKRTEGHFFFFNPFDKEYNNWNEHNIVIILQQKLKKLKKNYPKLGNKTKGQHLVSACWGKKKRM